MSTVAPRKRVKPSVRTASLGWAAELAILIAALLAAHLVWTHTGHVRDAEENRLIEIAAGAWLVWRLVQATKPRQRVVRWTRPRKADDNGRR